MRGNGGIGGIGGIDIGIIVPSYKWERPDEAKARPLPEGFCSSSGSGVVVKDGGKDPMFPPREAFVVVVVGGADKKRGGNEGDWRRQNEFTLPEGIYR